ncbi:MAG TPA: PEGA domain-containing protein [Vicinamibacteria bacterium]|nr:PEGA domain-containing protein [Vicinamibacteria bacterium]
MSAKRATVNLALVAALVLAGAPLQAQQRGGNRHHGGGYGGSHAVPRGSHGGGGAYGRHPRAGTGGYGYHNYYGGHRGYYGNGYYGHGYGHGYYGSGYGHHHGYGYRGYYGYYRPYSSFSFGFGWPYGYVGWGWPYGWADYYPSYSYTYAPSYGYAEAMPAREYQRPYDDDRYTSERAPASDDRGRLRLEVSPDDASVYVDGAFWGSAREARYLTLRPGRHTLEFVRPGFEVDGRDVEVVSGETGVVRVELQRR